MSDALEKASHLKVSNLNRCYGNLLEEIQYWKDEWNKTIILISLNKSQSEIIIKYLYNNKTMLV